jgi:hypothetical protein
MVNDNSDPGSTNANSIDTGFVEQHSENVDAVGPSSTDAAAVGADPLNADAADLNHTSADSADANSPGDGPTNPNPVDADSPSDPSPAPASGDYTNNNDDYLYRTVDGYQEPITQKLINNVQNANPERPQEVAGSQLELLARYRENVLKQARESFFWALTAAIAGIILLFATIITFLVTRSLNVPIISGIGSIVVEVVSGLIFFLRTQSSKQLEAFSESLVKVNYYMLANSLCESLSDYQARDATRIEIIRGIMFHATSYTQVQYTYGTTLTPPPAYMPSAPVESYAPPPAGYAPAPPPPSETYGPPPTNLEAPTPVADALAASVANQ